ncbi:MAG: ribose-5-phosphate isomerase RpiA [Planctomycetota bacterium]
MSHAKEAAGRRAAEYVEEGMTVGLGTGSTVYFTLLALGERVVQGLTIRGVPTSIETETLARELAIPLVDLADVESIDVTIDGADEIDAEFRLTKGGGGALLREKVIASISRREVIVVGRDKLVERLGTTFLLPVEVVPFARPTVARAIQRMGATPAVRMADTGRVYLTDNGNEILDCQFPGGFADPADTERSLLGTPGIVDCGLFLDLAHVVVIGDDDGTVEIREK